LLQAATAYAHIGSGEDNKSLREAWCAFTSVTKPLHSMLSPGIAHLNHHGTAPL
jgi:hypothetical protein